MGSADAVPGISGGTVALVIGLYRRLIDSIATVLDWNTRASAISRRYARR
ncbi:MAG: hypothetical protein CXX75_03745 [Methanobacteriota archaeon]|nr:MAG: hypothetical protein CXX75_03745 [Euryarchaeota archaeon]